MAKRKMKEMELMLAITMPMCLTLTILVITKNDLSGTDGEDDLNKSQKKLLMNSFCVELSLCYIPKVDDNDYKRLFVAWVVGMICDDT